MPLINDIETHVQGTSEDVSGEEDSHVKRERESSGSSKQKKGPTWDRTTRHTRGTNGFKELFRGIVLHLAFNAMPRVNAFFKNLNKHWIFQLESNDHIETSLFESIFGVVNFIADAEPGYPY